MKCKLTTCNKRALAFCESLNRNDGGTISVDWAKSATWGMNPRIEYDGGKCSNISGCGYDKLSACLASVLCFLFPVDSEAFHNIAGCGGAGESTIMDRLAKHGWKLEKAASGKTYDVYNLTRAA